jgi:two-component sensor histidine kinase
MTGKLNISATKLYLSILALLLIGSNSRAQIVYSSPVEYYNTSMKRLLALSAGNYINQVTQGQVDQDSAVIMACQIYHINRLVPYNENYDGDSITPGMKLIDAGKIKQARELLLTQKPGDKIKTLFELACYYLFKPGGGQSSLDSAQKYIKLADAATNVGSQQHLHDECLALYAQYYCRTGNIKEGQAYFSSAIKSLSEKNDIPVLISTLLSQASYLPYNNPGKLEILGRCLLLSQQNHEKIWEIEALTGILTIHFATNVDVATQELIRVLALQKTIGFRHFQFVNNTLAYIYFVKYDFVNALTYSQESIKDMELTGDVALSSTYYIRMGDILRKLNQPQQGLDWYDKALNGYKTKQNQAFWYPSLLAKIKWLEGEGRSQEGYALIQKIAKPFPPITMFDKMYLASMEGVYYQSVGQNANAERCFNQFIALSKNFPPEYIHNELPITYATAAEFYVKIGKFAVARDIAQRSIALAQQLKSTIGSSSDYLVLYQIDSASGNYKSAIGNLKKFKIIYDSTENTKQQQKYAELMIQYQTERKDRSIKSLQQNSEIQKVNLRHATYLRNMVLGGIALITVIAGLLYYLYRSKRYSNIQLTNQQKVITNKNNELEHLLTEKEWLVREIHHRVKNNLHTIVSLLESQTAYLGNDALAAVRDSQHRIHAMSLIHQKLYLTENASSVNMSVYIRELVGYLKDSFKTDNAIHFNLNIEPIELDVSIAIPIGLILNEAITNSIKYAFNKPGGEITIAFVNKGLYCFLTIADNGIGFLTNLPQNEPATSLGMTLMKGLCKEIKAEFNIENNGGTIITMKFSGENLKHS